MLYEHGMLLERMASTKGTTRKTTWAAVGYLSPFSLERCSKLRTLKVHLASRSCPTPCGTHLATPESSLVSDIRVYFFIFGRLSPLSDVRHFAL